MIFKLLVDSSYDDFAKQRHDGVRIKKKKNTLSYVQEQKNYLRCNDSDL